MAEIRFTIYLYRHVDLWVGTFAHVLRGRVVSGTLRETRCNGPQATGGRLARGSRPVESSVRSNGSFEWCLGALKPPDRKFRVAFGSGLVGWAPVPEELIEGGTGADRMCDQRFDGGDSLVGVHVQLCRFRPIVRRSRFGTSGRSGLGHFR